MIKGNNGGGGHRCVSLKQAVDRHAHLNDPAAMLPFSVDCCLLLIRVVEGLEAIERKDQDRSPVH